MTKLIEPILVVVFDASGARLFERKTNGKLSILQDIKSGLHRSTRETVSDKPGRGFSSAGSNVRHGFEQKHDPHKMEKHNFVHRIVELLHALYAQRKFATLAVVAPERALGEFRKLADAQLLKAVAIEVPKDLVHESPHELERHIAPFFAPPIELTPEQILDANSQRPH